MSSFAYPEFEEIRTILLDAKHLTYEQKLRLLDELKEEVKPKNATDRRYCEPWSHEDERKYRDA